jgi:hypothetical protein
VTFRQEFTCHTALPPFSAESSGAPLPGMVLLFLFLVYGAAVHAQAAPHGAIAGFVADPSGAAVVGARVMAARVSGNVSRTATTDAGGRFSFFELSPGRYVLHVDAVGFRSVAVISETGLRSAVTLSIVLAVQSSQETVTVEGTGTDGETASRAHTDIGPALTNALPDSAVNGGFSRVLTLGTPGVAAESNGGFHPLGEHAEVSFSVDGQPISDQQSRTFSNQVSLNTVESIDVITGAPPAEFGDKTSMIVRAVTRSGLGAGRPTGTVSLGYGMFGTGTADLSLRIGDSKVGNFFAADAVNSQRFLDSPEFVPLHAIGNAENIFDRIDVQPTPADSLHFNITLSRSWFQTPNTYDQENSKQDQRQFMRSGNFAVAYSHVFSPSWLLDTNLWWRGDRVTYYPSSALFADQPATFSQARSLKNFGTRVDASVSKGRHTLKTGATVQWTPLNESFATGLTDPGFNSPCVDQRGVGVPDATLTDPAQCGPKGDLPNSAFQPNLLPYDLTREGKLFQFHGDATIKEQSAYVQDSITLGRLTINPGLRVDHYDGISHSTGTQPRVGLSYQLPFAETVLRVSYARVMVTPYNENLVLSSATGPGGLAGGALGNATVVPLFPGRRNQLNVGLAQAIGKKITIDAEYFWKFTNGAFDFNVILDTPLNFPVQFAKAKIDGAMARVNLASTHGFSAFTVMGHTRSRLFSPEVGGINFGTQYAHVARPDHDQAFQQTTFLRYQPTLRAPWVGLTWRFDSGLVAVSVPDYATALTLSGDEQAQMGLYCGSVFAAVNAALRSCASPIFGATRVHIAPDGTYNPDRNPSRIIPRSLFDLAAGLDDIWHWEHYHLDGKITVTNLINKVALYNFLSSFSGTHFITPRSVQAELSLRF